MPFQYAGFFGPALVTNLAGDAQAATDVTVRNPDTSLANLWSDKDRSTAVANPVTTDTRGQFDFYAEPGPKTITANGITRDIVVDPHPDEGDFDLAAHVAAADPHPGYLTPTEGNAAYETPAGAQAKVDTAAATLIPLAQKGAADGVATLGPDGKLPSAQVPALALSEFLGTVASEAAMLALVGQRGDWAVRTDFDPDRVFILESDDPTQAVNWTDITTPGAVQSVNGQTGVVVLDGSDVGFTPTGGIAATDVQAAIAELDTEAVHTTGDESIAGVKTFTGTADVATLLGDNARFKTKPWLDPTHPDFGAVGNGTADDTAALQAWLNAIPTGGTGFLPDGIYKHNGTLTTPATDDITIIFGGAAWLAPTAGWGLKVNDFGRHKLVGPKVRLDTGSTATRGLWVFSAQRVRIYDPIVWSFIDIPAAFTAIDVDDNSYWCHIWDPTIRKDSGVLVGSFSRGIRFLKESNAGRVFGGDINHCTVGIYVDGSNNNESVAVAFEDCTTGVEYAQPSSTGNSHGGLVAYPRFESTVTGVLVSQTLAATYPWQVVVGQNGATTAISNPNAQPVYGVHANESVRIVANDKAFELRNGAVKFRDSSGNAIVESNGTVIINADLDASSAGAISLRTKNSEHVAIANDGTITITNARNIVLGTTTGTKFGTGPTEKIGFYGVTPVARAAAYTQTYATADRTLSAYTADPESTPYTAPTLITEAAKLTDANALRVAYENLRVLAEDTAQMLNAVVDDLQAIGIVQ